MYEAFWGLGDPPFSLTPDPRFLLRARRQHEILTALVEGVLRQVGVMALVGDVGTGKTLLCRALARELPKAVRTIIVSNPFLSGAELVGCILDELGVAHGASTLGEAVAVLGRHLRAADAAGQSVVVVIDEAQRMGVDTLEQIRVLSTFETETRKLLQVVLVGQPELEELLGRRELRQLDQRIGVRCHLPPLTARDTYRYVEHRLRVAGLSGASPFTRGALVRVWESSGGVPRVINLIADGALAAAWKAGASDVTPALVDVAARALSREPRSTRSLRRAVPAAAAAVVVLVGAAAAASYWRGVHPAAMPARLDAPAPPAALMSVATAARDAGDREDRVADGIAFDQLLRAADMVRSVGERPASGVAAARADGVTGDVTAGAARAPAARLASAGGGGSTLPPAAVSAPVGGSRDVATRDLLARLLEMWGISTDPSAEGARSPREALPGPLDVTAAAERHGLVATRLAGLGIADLRAIGLPAIIEVSEGSERRPYLVRAIEGDLAVLVAPTGDEAWVALDSLNASWTRSAWVLWRNEDQLPLRAGPGPTPTAVVAAVAARLESLGYLSRPLPALDGDPFRLAVRRFQSSVGLPPDGVPGPATVMALSRMTGGRPRPATPGH